MSRTFFPASAPFVANVVLSLEAMMAIALLFGAWAARARRYGVHAWCQSAVVLLNVPVIALAMAPSFAEHVAPKIPTRLGRPFYAIATVHGILGAATEIFALYIVVSAGTDWLPKRLRLSNYKIAMRSLLIFWWVAFALGVATYARWYVPRAD